VHVKLARRKKRRKTPPKRCKVVRNKRTGRRRKVCKKKVHRRRPAAAPIPQPLPQIPVPSAAAPPATTPGAFEPPPTDDAPAPAPAPPPPPPASAPLTRRDAERLLWRAGFGPRRGEAETLAAKGRTAAVESLTRPVGSPSFNGPSPVDEDGFPIDPENVWGHDHTWWIDRMVRSSQPLVERMTLIWHDWFATTNDDVGDARLMLEQNRLFRAHALGSFATLAREVTRNPAMLIFLNGLENHEGRPNENYARELMELFTLGADRGAYTETDVRELARALTGWTADWDEEAGTYIDFRVEPWLHDDGTKTLWDGTSYEKSGAFDWEDAVRLCLEHPMHAEFFVRKLWSYFIPTPPSDATRTELQSLYVSSGRQIRPVVEAILKHPDLYDRAKPMVKPPAVYTAGLLRARNRPVDTNAWSWLGQMSGQQLFYPPNVSGWNDNGWLDTSTIRGRWETVYVAIAPYEIDGDDYPADETPEEALDSALAFWDRPTLTTETRAELLRFATESIPATLASWEQGYMRAYRQNALRHLIATAPDFQTS
jgi:hypothetical protein